MSSKFAVKNKKTGEVIHCDWQNAFELVNHGFWEWAKGDGRKEFQAAQRLARNLPAPEGFDRSVPETDEAEDEDDDAPVVAPTPVAPVVPEVTVAQIATQKTVAIITETLEDMTRDELFAAAEKIGLTIDKRTGTKNLISAIRAVQEAE